MRNGTSLLCVPLAFVANTETPLLLCVVCRVYLAAEAQCMVGVKTVGRVQLQAIGAVGAQRVGRDAIEDEVADRIGREMQARVLMKRRHLIVEAIACSLKR